MTTARIGRTEAESDIDKHVGQRIKSRRTMMGVSQEKLGHECGITFQQVQKYECASNRVSVSRLFQIARVLNVEPSFFFEGLASTVEGGEGADPLKSNVTLEMIRLFNGVDAAEQAAVMTLLQSRSTSRTHQIGRAA